ncbi:DUF6207 family protein [Streptomyces sp. Ag109_O5-10]|uniref:DUF6207 family protein n=1 Tax=Streptomyces sp. Ag109_O5-10 TaxID=1855349 RepID=UPI002108A7C8|nr:DUF6207 family protein [Streptomyces sp. Ag109_O5-10]
MDWTDDEWRLAEFTQKEGPEPTDAGVDFGAAPQMWPDPFAPRTSPSPSLQWRASSCPPKRTGLVVVDVAAADEETALAFQQLLADRDHGDRAEDDTGRGRA